jgi:hypothetical protein
VVRIRRVKSKSATSESAFLSGFSLPNHPVASHGHF